MYTNVGSHNTLSAFISRMISVKGVSMEYARCIDGNMHGVFCMCFLYVFFVCVDVDGPFVPVVVAVVIVDVGSHAIC